jgi:hypothetical protein
MVFPSLWCLSYFDGIGKDQLVIGILETGEWLCTISPKHPGRFSAQHQPGGLLNEMLCA